MNEIGRIIVQNRKRRSGAAGLQSMERRCASFWKGREYSFTTGQFARLDRSYRSHCGPTAVTNLIFALSRAEGRPLPESPEQIFQKVAAIGAKRLFYMNTDFMKLIGGTSDVLAPLFVRTCLKRCGLGDYRVRGPFPASAERIMSELDKGAVLYLEVHRHPVYGSHHMVCYGYKVTGGRLMLRVADGWVTKVHELPAGEEWFALCTVISRDSRRP